MPEGVTDPNYKPPPGRLGNLTAEQQETLNQFKKELQDEGHFVPERMDDAMLLRYLWHIFETSNMLTDNGFGRFLRARKFDLPNAKLMLINMEKWRKDFGVDDIVKYGVPP